MRALTVNPVLARELTERWRGRRAVATLTGFLVVLSLLAYALYRIGRSILLGQAGFGADLIGGGPLLGRFLVESLLFFGLVGILFVAPGYAATQIAGERERRTLGLLQLTLLKPWQIVAGKLGAAVAWLLLLVVATIPVGAVAFFLGGVAPGDILAGLAFLLLIAVSVAAMGLGVSAVTRGTTAAVVLTYGVMLLLVLGTAFGSIVEVVARQAQQEEARTPIALYLNPFFGLSDAADAVSADVGIRSSLPSPLSILAVAHPENFERRRAGRAVQFGGPGARGVPPDAVLRPAPGEEPPPGGDVVEGQLERAGPLLPVWAISGGFHVLLGAAGLVIATRRLGRVEGNRPRRERNGRKGGRGGLVGERTSHALEADGPDARDHGRSGADPGAGVGSPGGGNPNASAAGPGAGVGSPGGGNPNASAAGPGAGVGSPGGGNPNAGGAGPEGASGESERERRPGPP